MDYRKEIITKTIEEMLNMEKDMLEKLRKEYSNTKTGKLIVRHRGNRAYYSEKINGREYGITKDEKRLHYVMRNIYLENKMELMKEIVNVLNATLYNLRGLKEINTLPDGKEDIKTNYSIEDWEWMKASYDRNTLYSEDLKYKTLTGTMVRTKSEWLIAIALEMMGIPYRYEQLHYIEGKVYYPDFTIRKPDGTVLIWEHFGLMNNPDYAKKAKIKIENYEKAGFKQHTNLICTYEDDIESQASIERIIKRFVFM